MRWVPFAVAVSIAVACGGNTRSTAPRFCGLVRTGGGFVPVEIRRGDISCSGARTAIARWPCSRAMHARYELSCRRGGDVVWGLEDVPVRARVHKRTVQLADWQFRLRGGRIEGRRRGGWITLSHAPFCVDAVPRPVLLALRLRPITPHGGCFVR